MNTQTEPEGGSLLTTIIVKNTVGNPWVGTTVEHNGNTIRTDKNGKVILHINGGALRIHGSPIRVKEYVTKGVENVFQHDNRTGSIKKINT